MKYRGKYIVDIMWLDFFEHKCFRSLQSPCQNYGGYADAFRTTFIIEILEPLNLSILPKIQCNFTFTVS